MRSIVLISGMNFDEFCLLDNLNDVCLFIVVLKYFDNINDVKFKIFF